MRKVLRPQVVPVQARRVVVLEEPRESRAHREEGEDGGKGQFLGWPEDEAHLEAGEEESFVCEYDQWNRSTGEWWLQRRL